MGEATSTDSTREVRNRRKERLGVVHSAKPNKTIVVRVWRHYEHPRFQKVVTSFKHYYAHDERNEAKPGDRVRIMETRPLSKLKRWRLVGIVRPGETKAKGSQ